MVRLLPSATSQRRHQGDFKFLVSRKDYMRVSLLVFLMLLAVGCGPDNTVTPPKEVSSNSKEMDEASKKDVAPQAPKPVP
jgi:hypothetical protein